MGKVLEVVFDSVKKGKDVEVIRERIKGRVYPHFDIMNSSSILEVYIVGKPPYGLH
jgi:hypothetical protein